jgi:hypothetical protein
MVTGYDSRVVVNNHITVVNTSFIVNSVVIRVYVHVNGPMSGGSVSATGVTYRKNILSVTNGVITGIQVNLNVLLDIRLAGVFIII